MLSRSIYYLLKPKLTPWTHCKKGVFEAVEQINFINVTIATVIRPLIDAVLLFA
jgi:hypothetical protein